MRTAFTLLEVILALAILAGSMVALGEVVRLAARSAEETQTLTRAQLLAVGKLAEITSGITLPEPLVDARFELDPGWVYSVTFEPVGLPGLVAVRVTVRQETVRGGPAVEFSLVEWLADEQENEETD